MVMIPLFFKCYQYSLHDMSKKFGESYQKTNKTKDTNTFSLLLFKIVAIRNNTRLTTSVQLSETISKGLLRNRSQNGCHMIFECHSRPQNVHLSWPPSSGETGRSPQEPDQVNKEDYQAQLPSSEPRIGARGSHCVQRHYRGAASHCPVLCNSVRTRWIRCSNRFKTA